MQNKELKAILTLMRAELIKKTNEDKVNYISNKMTSLLENADLRKQLLMQVEHRDAPQIYQDRFGVCFAGFKYAKEIYFLGPMSLVNFSEESLAAYCDYYGLREKKLVLKYYTLEDLLTFIGLIYRLVTGIFLENSELIEANAQLFTKNFNSFNGNAYYIKNEEEVRAHHTYQEERTLLEYVKSGAVEEALAYQRVMDSSIGRLSNQESVHWRNLAIVAITLTTRAAIDGGLSPALAYKISDNYIQKYDQYKTVTQLIEIRNQAVTELTENVRQHQKIQTQSSYIKASTSYIDRHYREKIYLEDVASFVGLSPTYFSKLFRKEVGMTFQNYVIQVRLEYAANLLRFSNESISTISEYVNFPTQSYFGRYFKETYHMTPKQYRDLCHVSDL